MFRKLVALFAVLSLFAGAAVAKPKDKDAGTLTVPITGTFVDKDFGPGVINGTFKIAQFEVVGDQIMALGTVAGTLTSATGVPFKTIVRSVSIPVTASSVQSLQKAIVLQQATCPILNLVLGPLHLDLLGLVIDLNQVVLDLTAESGPGNLLGNLLCGLVGILDGAAALGQISDLLNQILGVLSGLLG